MRRAILAAACALAGLLLQGCNEQFDVEMKPKDGELERRIKVYVESRRDSGAPPKIGDIPGDKLKKLRDLYKQEGEVDPDGKKLFNAILRDSQENIVGGISRFVRLGSDLGAVSFYNESFRHSDDLAGDMEKRLDSADRLADLLREWFELELGNEPRGKVLLDWIDKDFRKDVKNIALYLYLDLIEDKQQTSDELQAKLLTYLVNHNYLTKENAPKLVRAVVNMESAEGDQVFFVWLQRFVAGKMGVAGDKPVPEALAFLGSREKLMASMRSQICKTKTFKDLRAQEGGNRLDIFTPENPANGQLMFFALLNTIWSFDAKIFSDPGPSWTVKLSLPGQPFWSNGTWVENDKAMFWGKRTPNNKPVSFVYAAWAEPSERQAARFGKVLLDGHRLFGYALWFQALHENERAEWTAFVDTIKPGDDVKTALEGFRFKGETALDEKEVKPALSNAVRGIFREALTPEAPPPPEKP